MNDYSDKIIKNYYEEHPMGKPGYKSSIEEVTLRHEKIYNIIKNIKSDFVVDIGCGEGYIGKKIYNEFKNYLGLDISYSALETGKMLIGDKSDFCLADIKNIPIRNNCVDVLICSEVLEHIPKYDKVIKECYDILKTKGGIILTTPNYYNPSLYLRVLMKGKGTNQVYDKPIPYKKLINLLLKYNFEIKYFESFYYHYPLITYCPKILRIFIQKILYIFNVFFSIPLGLYLIIEIKKTHS